MERSSQYGMPLRRGIGFVCLSLLLVGLFPGCAATPAPPVDELQKRLVWPSPPEKARVAYVRTIQFPRDIKRDHKFWSRVKAFLFGEDLPVILRPYGLGLDQKGNLLIADPGAGVVHIYNLADGIYRQLPGDRSDLVLASPIDTDVDQAGRIYVSDSVAKKVYVFNGDGRLEGELEEFLRPTGLVVNKTLSRIYVVDTLGHRIRVFRTKNRKFLFEFGKRGAGKGEFNYPTNIDVDPQGNIYVTDSMNFRVQVFDKDGYFQYVFGKASDGPGGFAKARGIGRDSEGHIYVADAMFDNVQIFNAKGQTLLYFGGPGLNPGQFYLPAGIAVGKDDRIYVADSFNNRIQVFQYLKKEAASLQKTTVKRPASLLMMSRQGDAAFVIGKSNQTLFHYKRDGDQLRLVGSYPLTDKNLDQVKEGVYFNTKRTLTDTAQQHEVVLESAFMHPPISTDSQEIVLQWGGREGKHKRSGASGRIRLTVKEDITQSASDLRTTLTPFIVRETVAMHSGEDIEKAVPDILRFLVGWERSREDLDIERYMRLYSKDYRHRNMDLKEWLDFKGSIFANRQENVLTLRPIQILESGPYVMLTLLQSSRSGEWQDFGVKRILIREEGTEWKILREEWTRYEKSL